MHLVGGFNDDRQLSQKLTNQLLSKFTFFALSCPKKSSGWIWVEFVCSLSHLLERSVDSHEGSFSLPENWCGEGLDCWGLPMVSAWAEGLILSLLPVSHLAVEGWVQFSWALIPAHLLGIMGCHSPSLFMWMIHQIP